MARKKRQPVEKIEDIDFSAVKKESDRPKCFDGKRAYCQKELCQGYYDDCKVANTDEFNLTIADNSPVTTN